MKSLFDQATYQETKDRINALRADAKPQWGKMNVGQMLAHCQFPFHIALSDEPRKRTWNPIPLLWKKSMYSDKPWPKNSPTLKAFKVIDQRDLDKERNELLSKIDAFYAKRAQTSWQPHPFFGHFTPEQWGQMQFKHLDHHLTQFGV